MLQSSSRKLESRTSSKACIPGFLWRGKLETSTAEDVEKPVELQLSLFDPLLDQLVEDLDVGRFSHFGSLSECVDV